ncbi:1866_t:CDS:1 [Gigaspora rosea]|nr:1866_t:CDS:1 [Gigaspora rosea]
MRRAISDAFTDTLADLPASPDRIPNEIREELPFELPIHDRANTKPLVLALCRLYKFDKLPDNYFKRRYALPKDPQDLVQPLKRLFPITNWKQLQDLSNYQAELKNITN